MARLFLVNILFYLCCSSLFAAAATGNQAAQAPPEQLLVPAHFGRDNKALYNLIEFPRGYEAQTGLVAVVYCQVIVLPDGRAGANNCFTSSDGEGGGAFGIAVLEALKDAVFSPARAAGKPITVGMNLRVVFQCDQGQCDPISVPNFGLGSSSLGDNYISAQEIITDNNWYERFISHPRCKRDGKLREICIAAATDGLAVTAEIDRRGAVTSAALFLDTLGDHQDLKDLALQEVTGGRFIPAYHQGKFVALPRLQTVVYHAAGFTSDQEYEEVVVYAEQRRLQQLRLREKGVETLQRSIQEGIARALANSIYNYR